MDRVSPAVLGGQTARVARALSAPIGEHALAVFAGHDAIAVKLDLVDPTGTSRRLSARAGWQGRMKPGGLERVRIGRETRQSILDPASNRLQRLDDSGKGA